MDLSRFNLAGFGAWDAKLGLPAIHKVSDHAATDLICANIKGFVPFLRFNKDSGKLKVLVTSVLDPQLLETFKIKDIAASNPIKAVNRIKKSIKHDIFILIIHAQGERIHEIITGCGMDADLIIDGETGKVDNKTRIIAGKPVVSSNFGGKYLTYIDIVKTGQNGVFSVGQPVLTRVKAKLVTPEPEMEALVAKYEAERREILRQERERRERAMMKKRKPKNIYLGSKWCSRCHQSIVESWQKTRHAKAIHTLERKNKVHDPECLVCHVTGMQDKNAVNGFVSMDVNASMANVQCEACHGPGGRHAQKPHEIKMVPVSEKTCRNCHNHDTDPEFSYQHDLTIIKHDGEDVPVQSK